MAVAFDATSNTTVSGATSVTWSHTASGSNRGVIVGVSIYGNNVTGVTYGGVAMTQIVTGTTGAGDKHYMFELINPATGAQNIVVSFNTSSEAVVGANSFTGVHQTTMTGSVVTSISTGTNPSIVINSGTDEIVVDTLAAWAINPLTDGPGQTRRWYGSTSNVHGASSTEPGAATVTMSWSWGSNRDYSYSGVSIKAAAGGGPPTDSIDGNSTYVVSTNYGSVTVYSKGDTNFYTKAKVT